MRRQSTRPRLEAHVLWTGSHGNYRILRTRRYRQHTTQWDTAIGCTFYQALKYTPALTSREGRTQGWWLQRHWQRRRRRSGNGPLRLFHCAASADHADRAQTVLLRSRLRHEFRVESLPIYCARLPPVGQGRCRRVPKWPSFSWVARGWTATNAACSSAICLTIGVCKNWTCRTIASATAERAPWENCSTVTAICCAWTSATTRFVQQELKPWLTLLPKTQHCWVWTCAWTDWPTTVARLCARRYWRTIRWRMSIWRPTRWRNPPRQFCPKWLFKTRS